MAPQTKPAEPTRSELEKMLGESYDAFTAFLAAHDDLRPEWKYYGAKLGWNLKLFERKRNLCFIGAHEGYFNIAFILGAKAVEAALASRLSKKFKQELANGKQYPEGRGLRFEIRSASDLKPVEIVLAIKRSA